MALPDGTFDIPDGKVAVVVTSLEMRARPAPRPGRAGPEARFTVRHVPRPDPDWYRALFANVGADWLWFSRLKMAETALTAIIRDPDVEVYALALDGRDEGLLELDFRVAGACELAFFGLTRALIGAGAGRLLMEAAIAHAWARPIQRFWVHTCTGDHPAALGFYMRSGFVPYKRQIEIADDPRLLGVLPESAAPHLPIIGTR